MLHLTKNAAVMSGLFALLMVATTLPGCKKDFLDRQPLGQYTTDNYPYPAGGGPYDQYIYAAYAQMRTWEVSVFGFIGATSIRSDDADKGSTPDDAPTEKEMDDFPVTPTNSLTNDLWTGYYSLINKCNVVLNQVATDSTNTPESAKVSAMAEARFLRGYSYFMLVRLFGNVPLVDSVVTVSGSNISQSDPSVIYPFIEQDLQYAAANLPAQWPAKFIGRATSGAANGMLAKVYLTEKKWPQAMSSASLVINSGMYDLNTPYNKIFTEDGENSSESVFEIQAYADANHKEDSYGCQYANVQGVRGVDWNNLGWGFNVPSQQLEDAYEKGDPREDATILFCPSPTPTMYGEVFPAEPNPRYNKKVYTNPAVRNTVGDQFGWWTNVRILRYADVVLMYAEAANETGNTAEALQKLEWVRARARNGDNTILPVVTTTDQGALRTAIQHERRIELAMEHDRFFDLVRWGLATSVLHAAGKTNYLDSRDKLLPIPQAQIDLSKGILHQNPGY
ncbi:MAG TPA: RagB/SusD family nutrient uptake outer membrane protein [Chitinophagaceae bacterium]|nr:RagB/SusD family nutrient uptake outer membrane protein [Chitinophagaceae bacterium]